MTRLPAREVAQLCARLQASQGSDAKVQHAVAEAIRTRVLDSNTLQLLVQRLAHAGNWQLALRVLQSKLLDRHRVARDHNVWPLLQRAAPCDESRRAVEEALRLLYARTCGPRRR
ncbi:hypothetical protein DQ04_02121020 [Trypanosoma grayi]|uniref:hypothetical protein n=1 Tax=Trypanosoma grayi TaxID=71804 RepID=UPI0004F45DF8|nr:hypothetical protein DQ04_02121020 [Trypanosoma grayi]KEG11951.1 hypothetical protein DQ04_02121020 [Trypanosoma grayi]